jgi:hypothetical protein
LILEKITFIPFSYKSSNLSLDIFHEMNSPQSSNSKRDVKNKTGGKLSPEDIPAADIPAPSSNLNPERPAGGQLLRSSRRMVFPLKLPPTTLQQ